MFALNIMSFLMVIGAVSGFVDPLLAARRRAETLSLSMATVGLVFLIGAAALFELIGAGIHSLIGGAG